MQAHLSIPLANYPANVDKEANLYIHTNIAQLVNQAVSIVTVDQNDPHFFHHLYANLIFNYLGKWCLGDDGNPVQISVNLLEEAVRHSFGKLVACPIYPDEVLTAKFEHILREERAFVRTLSFAEENIKHNIDQMKETEQMRRVRDLPHHANRWKKWHPRTGFWYTRTPKATERTADKPGTLHTKKQPGSLLPTNVNSMNLFINQGVGLLFDFAELYHKQEKYCFDENAITNGQWWYEGNHSVFNPGSVGIEPIRAKNRRAVSAHHQINWNEIRVGLPKRCLRGTVALEDEPINRFSALLSMYRAKDEFQLDYELPVFVRDSNQPNGLRYYSHQQRLEDLLEFAQDQADQIDESLYNDNYVRQVVMTSFERLDGTEKQGIIEELMQYCADQNLKLDGFFMRKLEDRDQINLTAQPYDITFNGYQTMRYQVTKERVLFGLALVCVFPLAGVGLHQMIDEALQLEEAQWIKVARGMAITLATLTVLPLVFYGGYRAISVLATPTSQQDPGEQLIEVNNAVPAIPISCRRI